MRRHRKDGSARHSCMKKYSVESGAIHSGNPTSLNVLQLLSLFPVTWSVFYWYVLFHLANKIVPSLVHCPSHELSSTLMILITNKIFPIHTWDPHFWLSSLWYLFVGSSTVHLVTSARWQLFPYISLQSFSFSFSDPSTALLVQAPSSLACLIALLLRPLVSFPWNPSS